MSTPNVQQPVRATLTRASDDRMIAGVASGIARYIAIDPVIVRLVFVVLALAGGGGILVYLVAWVVMPEDVSGDGMSRDGEVAGSAVTRTGPSVLVGLILIAIGGILLVERLVPAFSWRYLAPVLLIVLGGLLLVRKGGSR